MSHFTLNLSCLVSDLALLRLLFISFLHQISSYPHISHLPTTRQRYALCSAITWISDVPLERASSSGSDASQLTIWNAIDLTTSLTTL